MYYLRLASCKVRNAIGKEKARVVYFLLILFAAWFTGLLTFWHTNSIWQTLAVCFVAVAYGCGITSLKMYDNQISAIPFEQNQLEIAHVDSLEDAGEPLMPRDESEYCGEVKIEKNLKLPSIRKLTSNAKPLIKKTNDCINTLNSIEAKIEKLDKVVEKKAIMKIVNDSYNNLKNYTIKNIQTIMAIYIASQALGKKELANEDVAKIERILKNTEATFEEFGIMLTRIPDAISATNMDIRMDIRSSIAAIEQFTQNITPKDV